MTMNVLFAGKFEKEDPKPWDGALEQLRCEHQQLREIIHNMERNARTMQHQRQTPSRVQLMALIKETEELVRQLERHSEWEASELFPMLTEQPVGGPEYVTSLWMLEKEHQLADVFFASFYKEMQVIEDCPGQACLGQALNHLYQACRVVRDHLESEEEMLLPLLATGEG
ncbi:hemerythrin domain-containing protein [Paenibacillus sp. NPDC056579]|uniref:hemerythrin domain-containing protein n=1 Tax=unclassified Paenibacillus TaxID=185978 RepID=UPI001EF98C51|nr:hemerythrin domain-containing protein [Paenibacillus sp. H1-7]ULL18649.1 hemerythrin domain-containing protein [Paenibacillus sp. H1-7]